MMIDHDVRNILKYMGNTQYGGSRGTSRTVSHSVHIPYRVVGSVLHCDGKYLRISVQLDLQFVNAGRGCNRRPNRRGILQSRSHNCFIGSHECLLLFTPSCCSECFYDL